MKVLMYDPPEGWKHGFPKPYVPLPDETLSQTLIRDGYPPDILYVLGEARVRFYETEIDEKQ